MATRSTEYGSSIDQAPLLPPQGDDRGGESGSLGIGRVFRGTARTIRQASGRRLMREPSMRVRETATEQLEERRSDVAYSKPVVYLDMIWNFMFVTVACVVLVLSRKETPSMPLRLWIVGYSLQCAVHMVCVCVEYRKRHAPRGLAGEVIGGGGGGGGDDDGGQSVIPNVDENHGGGSDHGQDDENVSAVKNLESANTFVSFIWWIIGFYWISSGGQALVHNAPQLYWLCIMFLVFDVFFVVFCVALACVVGIAVCCCLPCIIAILYAVADQEGATEEDIRQLTKYKFRFKSGDLDGGIMTECGTETPYEHTLSAEDAECCICLSAYDDGVELCELPCSHHFHSNCVVKWLYINATCPLCKYNIIKNCNNHGRQDV